MRTRLILGFIITGMLLTTIFNNCGNVGDAVVDTSFVADPEIGQEVYTLTTSPACISCHGADGTLEPGIDLRLFSDSAINAAVRIGPGGMPMYNSTDLTDQNIAHLIAYIRTL